MSTTADLVAYALLGKLLIVPYAEAHRRGDSATYHTPQTIAEMIAYCDSKSHIYVLSNSRAVRVKINGKTRRWKRQPDRFEIPIKYGLRECMTMTAEWIDRVLIPVELTEVK